MSAPATESAEKVLARALAHGDREAFDRLVKEYRIDATRQTHILKTFLFMLAKEVKDLKKTLKAQPPTSAVIGHLANEVQHLKQLSNSNIRWRREWHEGQGCDRNDMVIHQKQQWIARQTHQKSPEPGTDDGAVWELAAGTFSPKHIMELEQVKAQQKDQANRMSEYEKRPVLEHVGTWNETKQFKRGNYASFQGSTWYANTESKGVRPGTNGAWTLAAKSGRDGKDMR